MHQQASLPSSVPQFFSSCAFLFVATSFQQQRRNKGQQNTDHAFKIATGAVKVRLALLALAGVIVYVTCQKSEAHCWIGLAIGLLIAIIAIRAPAAEGSALESSEVVSNQVANQQSSKDQITQH